MTEQMLDPWIGEPVLLDVGASGGAPEVWLPLAKRAWYIAFDPDHREMEHAQGEGPFKKKTVVHEAITPDAAGHQVHFFLTRSPFCSSTLHPDDELVAEYFGAERFEVLSETVVHATTLNHVLDELGLTHLDWLKLDTQGTDRRIFDSLSESIRKTILAVDLEPGLRGAYVGEDLFGDVHSALKRDGFWLSHMQTKGFVRMRQETLDDLHAQHADIDRAYIERSVRRTPGWTELRYLRSIESLQAAGGQRREFALLWIIATLDAQHGFALDLARHWEKQFGVDDTSRAMRDESLRHIRAAYTRAQQTTQPSLRQRLKSMVRRFIPRRTAAAGSPSQPQSLTSGGGGVA
jgi:FkbM family methyltransferase